MWFARKVVINKDIIEFNWENYSQKAKIIYNKAPKVFRFAWLEDLEAGQNYYVEFLLEYDENIEASIIKITDFVEPEYENDAIQLWQEDLKRLKELLGVQNF